MNTRVRSEPVEGRVISGGPGPSTEDRAWFFRNSRGIDRLGTIEDRVQGRFEVDWKVIDRTVQEGLGRLTAQVMDEIPALSWKSNSHDARSIALSSYRIFERLDGDDFDPVYAGVTFVRGHGGVRVTGDISGEETGHIYFDRGCELLVTDDHQSVLHAAIEVAERLSEQARVVIEAIVTR